MRFYRLVKYVVQFRLITELLSVVVLFTILK